MPNQIIIVETPTYETKTEYGTRATEATYSEEYGRFEDLTRKLVQTPKAEVDKQRKKS